MSHHGYNTVICRLWPVRNNLTDRKTPVTQVCAKETSYYFTIKIYFVVPYHNNKGLLQAIFILYLLFYEVIQSKFFLVGKFDTRQENRSRYLWRKRTGWWWWRGERSKGRRNRKGRAAYKKSSKVALYLLELCWLHLVPSPCTKQADSCLAVVIVQKVLKEEVEDCGGASLGGLSPLWQDHSSSGGSSLSHSLIRSLAEIFQKSKTCDKSGRERHTPFIQTVLVRRTMSLSIQNRAFVLRSSTKSARFCQLLWLLKCESKKIKSL